MEVEVLEEKQNPFLKRKEVKVLITHSKEATPAKDKLKKLLAERYRVQEVQVQIDYVFSKKGLPESLARVNVLEEPTEQKKEEKREAQGNEGSKTAGQ